MKKTIILALMALFPYSLYAVTEPQEPYYCIQVIAPARNNTTGEVKDFPTPCDIPEGWEALPLGYDDEKKKKPPRTYGTAKALPERLSHLKGRILLQVQSLGEAWYVHPDTGARSYLGRPADAFAVMRTQGLGVSNAHFQQLFGVIPRNKIELPVRNITLGKRLSGKILIQVESHGEAYYLDPVTSIAYYLGRPADAFALMRTRGIGITDENLNEVPLAQ